MTQSDLRLSLRDPFRLAIRVRTNHNTVRSGTRRDKVCWYKPQARRELREAGPAVAGFTENRTEVANRCR